tara:strand:+ start:1733 stop:2308 length:576 start_codon:yes stop_codon:yes gene_type:complete
MMQAFGVNLHLEPISNKDAIQEELLGKLDEVDFNMKEAWGNTHYLSDPTFKENFLIEKECTLFNQELGNHIGSYVRECGVPVSGYKIVSSWLTCMRKGNYAHIHNHGNSHISGVYYIKRQSNDGNIFFTSPNPCATSNPLTSSSARMIAGGVPEGVIMLWPGFLSHGVETCNNVEDRISLSFNIDIESFSK